jgi:hypothetical protein
MQKNEVLAVCIRQYQKGFNKWSRREKLVCSNITLCVKTYGMYDALKMEALCISETAIVTYQPSRSHNPESQNYILTLDLYIN